MGARPSQKQLIREVPAALAALLDVPLRDVQVEQGGAPDADLLAHAAGHAFVIDVLARVTAGLVVARAERVTATAKRLRRKATPLLAVPFMTETGRRACERAPVPWFDLSGNAHIVAPGLRVIVDGRPNRFRGPGRPASVFAPKSVRVVRWLLMHPWQAITPRELARATDMDEGFVSRIARRLESDGYIARVPADGLGEGDSPGFGMGSGAGAGNGDGSGHEFRSRFIRVIDAPLLLDAWQAEYRFDRHTLIQGSVAARSGDALTHFVSDTFVAERIEHAATGLSAAWQISQFATFRIATFFVTEPPSNELRMKLGFREEARGANLWLVVPNDIGVIHGAAEQGGVRCVHSVQAYIDLKGHPERAKEAADRLSNELHASWRRDG